MALEPPVIDDRTFEDLVAELRVRIPRYAPEWVWNDFNETDPGITFTQLYAWLFSTVLYRFNRVPRATHIKLLQLLGIEPRPAQPARTELRFTLARDDIQGVFVPAGTQVAVGDTEGEPPVFETDETFYALGAALAAVVTDDGTGMRLRPLPGSTATKPFHAFGPLARIDSALMIGLRSSLALPSEDLVLAFQVHHDDERRWVTCASDLTGVPVSADLVWEYWDGSRWAAANLYRDDTRAFTRSGHVLLAGLGSDAARSRQGDVEEDLYWLRARLRSGGYEVAPQLRAVLTNTVSATQAVTIRDEVIGGSTGQPDQRFELEQAPVVASAVPTRVTRADGSDVRILSVQVEVDEGDGFEVWQEVDDLLTSGSGDRHFTVDRSLGTITFGDGDHGRIPLANERLVNSNIVARRYRVGGGRAGNVAAGTITELQTFVASVDTVTNVVAATGGSDDETTTEADARAARSIAGRDRAVTLEDFEYQATQAPGALIRRAKALPLRHPDYPGVPVPGAITVVVVPEADAPNPTPTEATLTAVCLHLDRKRLLTTEVYVVAPTYRQVSVDADLVARADADLAEVKRDVEDRLADFFDPLTGGREGHGWPFGGDIYFSEVYRQVLDVDGVDVINRLVLRVDDERQADCTDVGIDDGVLVYSDGHDVTVSYQKADR